jgi:hypothetical protein
LLLGAEGGEASGTRRNECQGVLQSSPFVSVALILSLSKDEGEPASWFDKLTMRLRGIKLIAERSRCLATVSDGTSPKHHPAPARCRLCPRAVVLRAAAPA